jgi:SAM-dependent methyltransferase
MSPTLTPTPALDAYEAFAPTYDLFTAAHEYELWLSRLEALAQEHGLAGRRVLDVGCGTGKSAEPLVSRGYEITACDLSPSMVAVARRRLGPDADVFVADMRDLPDHLGGFDLVTCLDDALNYLPSPEDLVAAFSSVRRVLAPEGLYVFDVNTLLAYQQGYAHDSISELDGAVFCWRAEQEAADEPDRHFSARLDAFVMRADGEWSRSTSRHEQRHFSDEVVRACLAEAGLHCVDVIGQAMGVRLSQPADETLHHKRLYIARRAA